ncbi:hypothetical protein L6V77_01285, partial [Myxococcota bacterium]|nr:hypothetical protein [Myxococcota bacterium]
MRSVVPALPAVPAALGLVAAVLLACGPTESSSDSGDAGTGRVDARAAGGGHVGQGVRHGLVAVVGGEQLVAGAQV